MDQALTLWIEEVKRFNGRLHLVSPSLEATLHEQVRDTMDLLGSVREGRIADLGSGSGFLGIPYKVMNPEAKVSLIERSGKKCLFLRHVIDRLGLLEISWYTGQLRRIGRGEAPRPNESGLWVLARQAWHMATAGKRMGMPGRLRAN